MANKLGIKRHYICNDEVHILSKHTNTILGSVETVEEDNKIVQIRVMVTNGYYNDNSRKIISKFRRLGTQLGVDVKIIS